MTKEKPDPAAARAELQRARDRRSRVERLVDNLRRERALNNFTGNIVATFYPRGER